MAIYTTITFKPPDVMAKTVAEIQAIQARSMNCVPVFLATQPKVVEMHKNHFHEANNPKIWVLKNSTIKKKKRLGYPLTPLVRTGKMRDKIGDHVPTPSPMEMRVGTTGWPAIVHHHGVRKGSMPGKPNYELPQRQYVGVNEIEAMKIRDSLHKYITEGTVDVSNL